jgi:hypothetical protein
MTPLRPLAPAAPPEAGGHDRQIDHSAVQNAARELLRALGAIDLAAVTAELERKGVRSFCDSYHDLLSCVETKAQTRS